MHHHLEYPINSNSNLTEKLYQEAFSIYSIPNDHTAEVRISYT